MPVTIIECRSAGDLKRFADFPYTLYKNDPYWVPPLKQQELSALRPTANPALKQLTAAFWIAVKDGKVAGRTGAVIHPADNSQPGKKLCRLTRTEFINDKEVSAALFRAAEDWARQQGMDMIHGPLGFTNLDHQGVLVEGFEHLPSMASEYHLPYYQDHFTANGYEKEMDWVEFRLKLDKAIPEKALKLNDMIQQRYKLKVVHFNSTAELKSYAIKIFLLLNIAFSSLFSFVPLDEETQKFYAQKYVRLLNPSFVKAVEDKDGHTVGFIISMPSMSRALQKAKGRLFPFGWYHLRRAAGKPQVVDLLLTGIHPDWQAQGISAILITELQKVMQAHGVEYVETTGILETNDKAINHWKNYEHIQHKRKRCYIKALV
ncbi:MAG: hypothetical protein U0U70_05405 [Chitinophagaceae bacterium]